jgi:predicted GTPase
MLGQVGGLSRDLQILNQGFWNDREVTVPKELGAIRILVCGNAGIGKSTLINKIFGVEVTKPSDRKSGVHNVRTEIKWAGRPDLVVHDSCGFETGTKDEINEV